MLSLAGLTIGSVILLSLIIYLLTMAEVSQGLYGIPYRIKTVQKVVALTFDDGPNPPYTTQLLDLFKDQNIKATFFIVGECAKKYPELASRIAAEGHQIGNHSEQHKFSNYFRSLSFADEIKASQKTIADITGQTPQYIRTPWLFRTPWIVATAKSLNLKLVGGRFCHPLEVFQISPEKVAKRALKLSRPGSIIIFHDGFDARGGNRAQTVEAVKLLVLGLKDAGFSFLTVEELLNLGGSK